MRGIFLVLVMLTFLCCSPRYPSLYVIPGGKDASYLQDKLLPDHYMDQDSFQTIIDSILNADLSNLEMLVQLCYPVRYDSLYDTTVSAFLLQLEHESEFEEQLRIANRIIRYGPHALTAFSDIPIEDDPKMAYWMETMRIALLGTSTIFYLENPNEYTFDLQRPPLRAYSYSHGLQLVKGGLSRWINRSGHSEKTLEFFIAYTVQSLAIGKPTAYFGSLLDRMITAAVKAKDDQLLMPLAPLFHTTDMALAKQLMYDIGAERDRTFYPQLLLDQLSHPNDTIVGYALDYTPTLWDSSRRDLVLQKVREIFDKTTNVDLKSGAAFVLLHDLRDRKAFDYFVDRALSGDLRERIYATTHIQQALFGCKENCDWCFVLHDYVFHALTINLNHSNKELQRAALETLLRYEDDKVISSIVPMVNYEIRHLKKEIIETLTAYPNREFVLTAIRNEMATTGDEVLREVLAELLKTLSQ